MPTHNNDSRNRFDAAAGISDGLLVGPSASIQGDNSVVIVMLSNPAGATVVMEMRRIPNGTSPGDAWAEIGATVDCSKQMYNKLISGFEYRAMITAAGDGSAPAKIRFVEPYGNNRSYEQDGRDFEMYIGAGFSCCSDCASSSGGGSLPDEIKIECDPIVPEGLVTTWS